MTNDVLYFRQRASEERRIALATPSLQVRRIHLELAYRYEGSIRAIARDARRATQARKAGLDVDGLGQQLAARKDELKQQIKTSGLEKPELSTLTETQI